MTPDPTTKEGREEIARRAKKRSREVGDVRERACKDVDKEPSGKFTEPNDIDRVRDRKSTDD